MSKTHPRSLVRRRAVAATLGASLLVGASVGIAAPASANSWTTCITPYQKAWNSTSGDVSDLIFSIGFANCAAQHANAAWNAGNVDLYHHYYTTWRTHYANATRAGATIAVKAWQKLAKFGIKKGIARL